MKIEEKTAYYIRIRCLVFDNLINHHRNTLKTSMKSGCTYRGISTCWMLMYNSNNYLFTLRKSPIMCLVTNLAISMRDCDCVNIFVLRKYYCTEILCWAGKFCFIFQCLFIRKQKEYIICNSIEENQNYFNC